MARNSLKNVINLLSSDKPVEEQFLNDLKRSIELTDEKNYRKPSQTYKPSGMNCMRAMYYGVTGVDVEPKSNYVMVGICNSGSDHHNRIQWAIEGMKDNGIDCTYVDVANYVVEHNLDYLEIVAKQGNETKLYHKDLNMSFLCDGIILYKGKYYIVEFKTESIYKWQSRKGVDPKHYNQATAYSEALGLSDVIFVYINRDLCDMKSYLYHVSASDRNAFRERIRACDEYVINKQLPPIEETVTPKTCEYCSYKDLCRKEVEG